MKSRPLSTLGILLTGIAARQQNNNYQHGRAPLGFEKDDGRLIEGENYDNVATVLEMVDKDNMSKRKAAQELETSRSTNRLSTLTHILNTLC